MVWACEKNQPWHEVLEVVHGTICSTLRCHSHRSAWLLDKEHSLRACCNFRACSSSLLQCAAIVKRELLLREPEHSPCTYNTTLWLLALGSPPSKAQQSLQLEGPCVGTVVTSRNRTSKDAAPCYCHQSHEKPSPPSP